MQKTIEDKNKGEDMPVGIECFVRCVSNKIDTVKDDVRSLCLNFDIHVGGELLGKGNNLNVNNLTPADYEKLCAAFGVNDIREDTPFVATLMTAGTYERQEAWKLRMAKKDSKVSEDQTDVTEDPNEATAKQSKYVDDLVDAKESGLEAVLKFRDTNGIKDGVALDREQASDLIDILKDLDDKPGEIDKINEAMEEQAVKMGFKENDSPGACDPETCDTNTKEDEDSGFGLSGNVLIGMADFPTRTAGGLVTDVVVQKNVEGNYLFAHATFKKEPSEAQQKSIPKKLKEITGLDWEFTDGKLFNANKKQLNKE